MNPNTPTPTPRSMADNGGAAAHNQVENAADAVHSAVNRASDAARPAVDSLAAGAHNAVNRVAGAATQAVDAIDARGDQLLEAQSQMAAAVRTHMREKPLATIGMAVAAGFVLNWILSGKR